LDMGTFSLAVGQRKESLEFRGALIAETDSLVKDFSAC
jgi:hypothetical protein